MTRCTVAVDKRVSASTRPRTCHPVRPGRDGFALRFRAGLHVDNGSHP